jgi:signal transduction histidine kinase
LIGDLSHLTDLAPEAGIAFEVDVPKDLMVDADPDQLTRVLVNLIRNAVQALSQAGATEGRPSVKVSGIREGRAVTILVEDNGPGIPERVQADLFTPFQGSARKGGAGLGLSIASELVGLHGGAITLDRTAIGTRFRVTIPDRPASEQAG